MADIRTMIYRLDFFNPGSGTGYGINAFLFYSDGLAERPIDELEAELGAMVSEGLLKQESREDMRVYGDVRPAKIIPSVARRCAVHESKHVVYCPLRSPSAADLIGQRRMRSLFRALHSGPTTCAGRYRRAS